MKEFPANGWRITQTISALSFFFCVQARAHVYVVTDTNDTTSVTSLRGAIIDANARGGENTIILGEEPDPRRREPQREWTFYLTIQGADEDAAATGDLDVTRGRLTIIGATPNVTINAAALGDRVFQVFSNAQLTLAGLSIEGGATPFNTNWGFGEPGGAVFNAGTLIMQACLVSGNSVGVGTSSGADLDGISSNNISLFLNGGNGGGIFNVGYIELDNCVISSNSTGAGYTSQTTLAGINGGDGGGIYNLGKMVLNKCFITGNLSGAGGKGGTLSSGIGADAGAGGSGAGIFNLGRLVLNLCTISTNLGGPGGVGGPSGLSISFGPPGIGIVGGLGGNGGDGAGIFNNGQLEVGFCTINDNHCGSGGLGGNFGLVGIAGGVGGAGGSGAGIFTEDTLALNTCTVCGNVCGNGANGGGTFFGSSVDGGSGGSGGGVFNTGAFMSTSCTIAFNMAGAGGNGGESISLIPNGIPASGGQGGGGGGILNATNVAAVVLRNTMITLNSANSGGLPGTNYFGYLGQGITITNIGNYGANGVGPDLSGGFTSDGFNLIGAADGSTGFANGVLADQVGTTNAPIDPLIGPLQMNGGPTATHALLRGSPAINKGNCFGVHQDQRGEFRPFDYPGISFAPGGDGSDIGAFELHLNERFEPPRDIFDRR